MHAGCVRWFVLLLAVAQWSAADRFRRQDGAAYDDDFGNYTDASSYDRCPCDSTFPCFCVDTRLCYPNGTVRLGGGGTLTNLRSLSLVECSEDEICCAYTGDEVPEPDGATDRPDGATGEPEVEWPECGKRKNWPRVDHEVDDIQRGEFSWMAALLVYNESANKLVFRCGASIIGAFHVLTAGHCVQGLEPDQLVVKAGAWDLSNEQEDVQELQVSSISRHPSYSFDPISYDVALVVTAEDFRPGPTVSTLCLPREGISFPPNTPCVATGWSTGELEARGTTVSVLRRADIFIVSHKTCQKKMRRTYLGRFFMLHSSFLCAGGGDTDVCTGDGGGPLMCDVGGSYYQAGIVSWGIGCDVPNSPAVYANVSLVMDWIHEQLEIYKSR